MASHAITDEPSKDEEELYQLTALQLGAARGRR